MVLPRFVSAALKNEPLTVYGTGSQSRCFCHVDDAVAGVLQVIDSNAALGEVFNIGNDEEITIENLACEVVRLTESTSKIEKVLYDKVYPSGFEDMHRRVPNVAKIRQVTGWEPKLSLEAMITDIADYLRE